MSTLHIASEDMTILTIGQAINETVEVLDEHGER